jgi:hypothetical protein
MSEEVTLQYPPFDEETGKVNCQICGKPFLVISPRHLGRHNITYSEYTSRYPNAPLSSKEFSAKTKYGKVKDLFKPKYEDQFEEVVVEEEPNIEDDIDIEKMLKEKSYSDPVKQSKAQVLDTLRSYFTNIRPDYMIEEYGKMSKRLKYQFITDFTDPILRVVVQCPNAFWHNNDTTIDPMKNDKLRQDGWKVIIISQKSPTRKEIQRVVDMV